MTDKKMKTIHRLAGKIVLKSGLHIGAGNDVIEIGGLDNPVVKDVAGRPYIPGSSIKGKLRSIMEWCEGKVSGNEPCSCGDAACIICRVFGPHKSKKMELGPPRLIVRDAVLSAQPSALGFTEAKYENTINRIDGTAVNPRQIERVHPETAFTFEIIYRNYLADEKAAEEDRRKLENGLKLLEHDYLGGSGSRGSGRVRFVHEGWQQVFPE